MKRSNWSLASLAWRTEGLKEIEQLPTQFLLGHYRQDGARVCTAVHGGKIRGNECKLKKGSY